MEITEHGKLEVAKSLDSAMKVYDAAKENFAQAVKLVQRARKQTECGHKNLELIGTHVYLTTECKDCGYTWYS